MIDQERVREMTKLATLEIHDGKKYKKTAQLFRIDYVHRQLMVGFLAGTAAFAIGLGVWVLSNFEELADGLDQMDVIAFALSLLSKYILAIVGYLILVDIYANFRYSAGQSSLRRYQRHLKRMERIYEEEEGSHTPDGLDQGEAGLEE